ncbi:MAG: hypothetical protein BJ554DRAFT_4792, partial [Olpidium bornovanus]
SDISYDLANWPPPEQNGADISELNFSLESNDECIPETIPRGYRSPDHALPQSIPKSLLDAGPGQRCNASRLVPLHTLPRVPELDAARDCSAFTSHSLWDHVYAHEAAWPPPASRDTTSQVSAVDTTELKVIRKTFRVRYPAVKFARRLSESFVVPRRSWRRVPHGLLSTLWEYPPKFWSAILSASKRMTTRTWMRWKSRRPEACG